MNYIFRAEGATEVEEVHHHKEKFCDGSVGAAAAADTLKDFIDS